MSLDLQPLQLHAEKKKTKGKKRHICHLEQKTHKKKLLVYHTMNRFNNLLKDLFSLGLGTVKS